MTSSSTERKKTRTFGSVAFVFFGLLCATGIWRHREAVSVFFGILSILGLGLLVLPGPLAPLHRGWLRTAHFIGRAFTVLMLTAAYYIMITPVALVMRTFRGSPLPLAPDRSAESYWIRREEPVQPRERFIKRF